MSSVTSSIQPIAKKVALPEGVTVSDIKPAVGAYISGYRFDGVAVSDAFQATIRDLIYNRGVIVFEPGTVTVQNFTKLVGFLGKFMNISITTGTILHGFHEVSTTFLTFFCGVAELQHVIS